MAFLLAWTATVAASVGFWMTIILAVGRLIK